MSSFKVWIDDDNITDKNILSADTYSADVERKKGFQPNTVASSSRANSGLRQANLVACALMEQVVGNDETLNLKSSVNDVKTAINKYFTETLKVKNSSNADNSTNVTTNINGKAISNIFENDGITIKNSKKVQNVDFSTDSSATFGDYVIRKEKILWEGNQLVSSDSQTITFDDNLNIGDVIEVTWGKDSSLSSPKPEIGKEIIRFEISGLNNSIAASVNKLWFDNSYVNTYWASATWRISSSKSITFGVMDEMWLYNTRINEGQPIIQCSSGRLLAGYKIYKIKKII